MTREEYENELGRVTDYGLRIKKIEEYERAISQLNTVYGSVYTGVTEKYPGCKLPADLNTELKNLMVEYITVQVNFLKKEMEEI
jgi:hypothetical protein